MGGSWSKSRERGVATHPPGLEKCVKMRVCKQRDQNSLLIVFTYQGVVKFWHGY